MKRRTRGSALGAVLAASVTLVAPVKPAQAYNPTGGIMYRLGNEPCLKGRGSCAIYPKSAQLPSGRLVASFEKATVVPATGSADGETLPIYASDDRGTTWRPLPEVKAPAYLSNDPRYAKYTGNWTNPFLYTLPQDVGGLRAGTLLGPEHEPVPDRCVRGGAGHLAECGRRRLAGVAAEASPRLAARHDRDNFSSLARSAWP